MTEWETAATVAQVITGVVSLVVATLALFVSLQQLKPLRRELAKLHAEDKRRETLRGQLPSQPRRLLGYDPRFTNWDWTRLLSSDDGAVPLTARLSRSYSEFYTNFPREFPDDGIIVVDLLFVPDLLRRG